MDIRGYPVRSVWCETGLEIGSELYLGLTLDRDRRRMAVIFSAAGGMEIEQVAEESPEKIAKLWPDPFAGPQPYEIRQMVFEALRHAPQLRDQGGQARRAAGGADPEAVRRRHLTRRGDVRDQPAGAHPGR